MEKEIFNRLLTEFTELNERVHKCRDFILDTEKFETIDIINRDLLIAQLKAMETYLSILSIRLGLNSSEENKVEIPVEDSTEAIETSENEN